jgi:hypothetical protein
MRWLLFIAIAAHPYAAVAEDLDTCVINGLKGVTSDVAARLVRQACENKITAQRRKEIASRYGERVDLPLKWVGHTSTHSSGEVRVTVKNESSQTVLYVELGMSALHPKDGCPWLHTSKWLYQVKVKPDASAVLVVPGGTALLDKEWRVCGSAAAVRAREPSFLDVSIGAVSPLTTSQVKAINQELGERYASTSTWEPAPLPGPAVAPAPDISSRK